MPIFKEANSSQLEKKESHLGRNEKPIEAILVLLEALKGKRLGSALDS